MNREMFEWRDIDGDLGFMDQDGAEVNLVLKEWNSRQLTSGLTASARVLLTYADAGVGHDGGLYLGAGALPVGRTVNGKLAFAWALDGALTAPLQEWARAIKETR